MRNKLNTLAVLARRNEAKLASFGLLAASIAPAHAEVDVTAVTAAGVSVGVVGVAVFAVYVGIRVYKWIKAAL